MAELDVRYVERRRVDLEAQWYGIGWTKPLIHGADPPENSSLRNLNFCKIGSYRLSDVNRRSRSNAD
jgi:hypothetical protein